MNNRGFNAAHHGLSAQPMFGGPVYFIKNIVYNVPFGGAIKTGGANPAGVLIYNNTFIAENADAVGISNVHYRNNLFFGSNHPNKFLNRLESYTTYSTSDYNGYQTGRDKALLTWGVPKNGMRDYQERPEHKEYDNLKELNKDSGLEEHGILLDQNIFEQMVLPDFQKPHAVYFPESVDFRLRSNSAAIDAGILLSNINDEFTGAAPDLGALEYNSENQVYGPRK
jgi:hypothetical protein